MKVLKKKTNKAFEFKNNLFFLLSETNLYPNRLHHLSPLSSLLYTPFETLKRSLQLPFQPLFATTRVNASRESWLLSPVRRTFFSGLCAVSLFKKPLRKLRKPVRLHTPVVVISENKAEEMLLKLKLDSERKRGYTETHATTWTCLPLFWM